MRLTPDDVRAALRRRAGDIEPDADQDPMRGMDERIRTVRRARLVSIALSTVSFAMIVLMLPSAVRAYRSDVPAPAAGRTPSASAGPAAPPAVGVYYLKGGRLAREFRQVGDPVDRAQAAVDAMLTEPPLDPDYSTGWPAGATAVVRHPGGAYAVDVSAAPVSGCIAVQQLVHTVTAASPTDGPVVVRIGGLSVGAVPALRGCGAGPAGAVGRLPGRDVLIDVQLSSPNESDRVPRYFTLTGHSRVEAGSLRWAVTDPATGGRLESGAPAGLGDSPAGWTIEVALPRHAAGHTVDVTLSGTAADGSTATDSKRIRVAD